MKKIIVTGATGMIGQILTQLLISRGDEVTIFSRTPESAENKLPGAKEYVKWNTADNKSWKKYVDGKDAIIHLAGHSLFGNLASDSYKEEIINSRVEGTRVLVEAISEAENKPDTFISASAIGYYGPSLDDNGFTENCNAGIGFLADVCVRWEDEAKSVQRYGIRWVSVRVGVILDKYDGALEKLLTPFNLYLGGNIGDGNQWISWIHNRDAANLFIYVLDNENIRGPVNAVAPNPVRMKEFTSVLGEMLGKPVLVNIPKFPLKILLGDASMPATEGIKVYPEKIRESGFNFQFERIETALSNLI